MIMTTNCFSLNILKNTAILLLSMLSIVPLPAQNTGAKKAIGFGAPKNATIAIETKDNALILQTDKTNRLLTQYFGKRLLQSTEYPTIAAQYRFTDDNAGIYNHVYTPSGSWNMMEPALKVTSTAYVGSFKTTLVKVTLASIF